MAKKNSKRQQSLSATIANRLNFLFFLVVVLFSILILRLAQMQLIDKAFYTEKLDATYTYLVKTSNPRGQIYDAKQRPLVETKLKEVVAFTRNSQQTAASLKELAQALAEIVPLSEYTVSRREKVDYYLADMAVYREIVEKLPDDKRYDSLGNYLPESTIYQNAVDSVPEEVLDYSPEELKIIGVFTQMNATAAFDTVSLTTAELTAEQIAKISAAGKEMAAFTVRTDWERSYLETSLSPLLGRISSSKTGLPAEDADYYLAKGYSLNDRVGTSYLEKSYEEYLQGQKTVREIKVDKEGKVLSSQETEAGHSGQNLQLTIDLEFQEGVEQILTDYFQNELNLGHAHHTQGVYAVALEPATGAVLAMAGIEQGENGLEKNALGTLTKVFTPGSVVKGATIAAGWENGVLEGNHVLVDQPIQFASSQAITSWYKSDALSIAATQALEYSSNTYMVQVALKLMGQEYYPGMVLTDNGYKEAMQDLRETYAQFGMGASTGIDIPGESIGYISEEFDVANVLTESFGQYDNYTPLQLAQYVATVANDGKRVAPHLVSTIYESNDIKKIGREVEAILPKELNQVAISPEEMSLIQSGFYQVVNGNATLTTGGKIANGASVTISAKTGTAESYVQTEDGQSVYTSNLNVVAYAPSHNPQIAVAVVFPNNTDLWSSVSHYISRDIINLYHSINPMY